jgi:hypothetical protein
MALKAVAALADRDRISEVPVKVVDVLDHAVVPAAADGQRLEELVRARAGPTHRPATGGRTSRVSKPVIVDARPPRDGRA